MTANLRSYKRCQFSNWMSSSQFQCHRDVINDTKVRIGPTAVSATSAARRSPRLRRTSLPGCCVELVDGAVERRRRAAAGPTSALHVAVNDVSHVQAALFYSGV